MQQSFSVSDSTLTICCRLRNEDSKAFPAGFGFHPYYNRALAGNDEEVTLSFSAQGAYPFSGDLPLPDGMALPLTEQLNFLVPREIPEKLDHCFAGFGGTAKLRWPTSKVTLQLEASAAFSHFVVYSPPGKPFVALEPQTQMNDGFNYLARGETSTGVVVLEPTQELAASVSLAVRAD
jgi:aldose 1-epimerase